MSFPDRLSRENPFPNAPSREGVRQPAGGFGAQGARAAQGPADVVMGGPSTRTAVYQGRTVTLRYARDVDTALARLVRPEVTQEHLWRALEVIAVIEAGNAAQFEVTVQLVNRLSTAIARQSVAPRQAVTNICSHPNIYFNTPIREPVRQPVQDQPLGGQRTQVRNPFEHPQDHTFGGGFN